VEVAKLVKLGSSKNGPIPVTPRVRLSITQRGLDALEKLARIKPRSMTSFFQNLSEQEFKEFRRLVGKLASGAERE